MAVRMFVNRAPGLSSVLSGPILTNILILRIVLFSEFFLEFCSFYHTAIHGCAGIVFILDGRSGGRMGGRAAAATLSGLDLCDHKLEEVQTWHTGTYHGLVVQRHGQTRVQPLTLTL